MRAQASTDAPPAPARARMLERRELPMQSREALLEPATFDPQANTVEVVWTTGARRRAIDWWSGTPFDEELVVEGDAVDMSRFEAGTVQVLDGHRVHGGVAAILGVAERGWIAGGQGRARLRLSQRRELAGIVADIRAGVIRAISFGYSVQRYEITRAEDRTDGGTVPLYRAVAWTPIEISFVTAPADPNASTRSAERAPVSTCVLVRAAAPTVSSPTENRSPTMGPDALRTAPGGHDAAGIQDSLAADIAELCVRHGVADLTSGLIRSCRTIDAARSVVLQELAVRDAASGGHLNVIRNALPDGLESRELMADALAARMGGPRVERSNPYRNVRLVDMARELLERHGVRTTTMSASDLIERAGMHTSGDFPGLLQDSGQRVLRQGYLAYEGGVRRAFRASTARDFRAKAKLMLGEMPELKKVNEHGEFGYGTTVESKASYSLATYGRIFAITRQALVNDDLDSFADLILKFGRAAIEFESKFLVNLLTSNPTMPDSVELFHADHGNLGTGAGSALSLTSLGAAVKAMRLQKGLDGVTPIDVTPRFLIVPAALEMTAYQFTSTNYVPAQASNVNPWAGRLEVIVDPRLDAVSPTAWYLAADPAAVDTVEYSYLEGEEGPQVKTDDGFEVDGLRMRVRLDFGAGAIDHRGLYRADGA